ncbi:MAG: sulfotransferase domain-containing protein [Geminicoccaceae bacterium]|nr:sulfotransferase domain-containing protein [Geminicoccaceae bacterium]
MSRIASSPFARIVEEVRAWRRLRRRTPKRLQKLETAHVIFLSPAKAGRTWVRVMLTHLCHQRYGTPLDTIIADDNLHRAVAAIPIVFFTHDVNEPPAVRARLSAGALGERRLVHLVRDPRDVTVSRFHELAFRKTAPERRLRGLPPDLPEWPLFAFALDERMGLPFVIESMNRWARERAAMPRALLVRYEDLRAEPLRELGRLADFLGLGARETELAAAVEYARFERLQAREVGGFYDRAILRPGDRADPRTYKVRRGEVGGYRNDFSPEEVAVLDRLVDERLLPGYGYTSSERERVEAAPGRS